MKEPAKLLGAHMSTKPNPQTQKTPAKPKLTLRQQRFVEALPTSKTQAEAAEKAGYSTENHAHEVKASQLVRNVKIQEALLAQQEADRTSLKITRLKIGENLNALASPDMVEKIGASNVIAANLGLAKLFGLIVDLKADLSPLSDADLVKKAREAGLPIDLP